MHPLKKIEEEIFVNANQLKYLKFEFINHEHVATLIDSKGHDVIKGYGNTITSAINDLHSCLI